MQVRRIWRCSVNYATRDKILLEKYLDHSNTQNKKKNIRKTEKQIQLQIIQTKKIE